MRRPLTAAAASGRRCSPQNSARPTTSTGSASAPWRQQPQCGPLHGAVAAQLAGGAQAFVQAEVRGRRRLGEDLGVVDVVAAAEGQATGGEHELRRAAALGGEGGDAHGAAPGCRLRLGPHQRQLQLVGALLGGAALRGEVAGDGQGLADGRLPAHVGEASVDPFGCQIRPWRGEIEEETHAWACRRRVRLRTSGTPLGQ